MAGRTLTQHAVPIDLRAQGGGLAARRPRRRATTSTALALPVQFGGAAGTLAAAAELATLAGHADPARRPSTSPADGARSGLAPAPPWHTARAPSPAVGDALVALHRRLGRIAERRADAGPARDRRARRARGAGRAARRRCRSKPTRCCPCWSAGPRSRRPRSRPRCTSPPPPPVDERPTAAGTSSGRRCAAWPRRTVVAASQAAELLAGLRVDTGRMRATRRGAARDAARRAALARRCAPLQARLRARLRPRRRRVGLLGATRPARRSPLERAGAVPRGGRHDCSPGHRRPPDRRRDRADAAAAGASARRSARRPTALWAACAAELSGAFDVVGWDLPGHGRSRRPDEPFTVAELAAGVLALVDEVLASAARPERPSPTPATPSAGPSGCSSCSTHPGGSRRRCCSAPARRIGDPGRVARAGRAGPRRRAPVMVLEGTAGAWFAPGFLEREPATAAALLGALEDADDDELRAGLRGARRLRRPGPARARSARPCSRWPASTTRSPPAARPRARSPAGSADGRLVVLDGVRPPAARRGAGPGRRPSIRRTRPRAAPASTAAGTTPGWRCAARCWATPTSTAPPRGTTDLTREFQDFITGYAWGEIWTRPGSGPPQPLDDHPDRAGRPRPPRGAGDARPRAPAPTASATTRSRRCSCRRAIYCGVPDGQHRVPGRPARAGGARAGGAPHDRVR